MLFADVTDEVKNALRKTKSGPICDVARNTLVKGCIQQGAYIQFGSDFKVYGLWGALMSADSYEKDGYYAPGSVAKTLEAVVKKMTAKLEKDKAKAAKS